MLQTRRLWRIEKFAIRCRRVTPSRRQLRLTCSIDDAETAIAAVANMLDILQGASVSLFLATVLFMTMAKSELSKTIGQECTCS